MACSHDGARRSPRATFDQHDYTNNGGVLHGSGGAPLGYATGGPSRTPMAAAPSYVYHPHVPRSLPGHHSAVEYQNHALGSPPPAPLSGPCPPYAAGDFSSPEGHFVLAAQQVSPRTWYESSRAQPLLMCNYSDSYGSSCPPESPSSSFTIGHSTRSSSFYSSHHSSVASGQDGEHHHAPLIPLAPQPTRYTHTDLGPDEIRLLKLHPGAPSDPLQGQLIKVSTAETSHLGYEALSYAWGSSTATHTIYLSDGGVSDLDVSATAPPLATESPSPQHLRLGYQTLPIRPSLNGALKRLRSATRDTLLWVDALCIDQANGTEKARQLPIMPQIYSNAWSVVIWIGEEPGMADLERTAMDFVPRMLNLTLLDSLLEHNEGPQGAQVLAGWIAFAELLKRPWFHRRWVIQEIAYARRVAIRCGGGSRALSWMDFADAIEILMRRLDKVTDLYKRSGLFVHDPEALDHVHSGRALALVHATHTVFRKSRGGEVLDRLWSLESLVTEFTSFEVTDPRDVIYAFLSLANDGPLASGRRRSSRPQSATTAAAAAVAASPPAAANDDDDEEAAPGGALMPQYRKHPIDVYVEFVKYCVETTGSLDIICRHWASYDSEETPLPSWIGAVWDSAFGAPSHSTQRINADSLVGKSSKQRIYNASKGFAAEVRFEKPSSLSARREDAAREAFSVAAVPGLDGSDPTKDAVVSKATLQSPETFAAESPEGGNNASLTYDGSSTGGQPRTQPGAKRHAAPDATDREDTPASGPGLGPRCASVPNKRRRRQKDQKQDLLLMSGFECCLFAKGVVLTRISQVSPPVAEGIIPADSLAMLGWHQPPRRRHHLKKTRTSGGGGADDPSGVVVVADDSGIFPPDQLWRTLVADRDSDGRNAPMWYKRACAYAMLRASPEGNLNTSKIVAGKAAQPEAIVEYCRRVQGIVWSRTFFVGGGGGEDDDDDDGEETPHYSSSSASAASGRRSEKLVGLDPRRAALGDLVCILFGCSVPVVLREVDGGRRYYKLVGEAYVYGKMDGEAFAGLDAADVRAQAVEFEIR